MRSRKSSVLLWEHQIQPALHLCVWVEREFFVQAEYLGVGSGVSASPHTAKHSACVQLWIPTNLAILSRWADGVPKVHLQVRLAQRVHFLVKTMSQVGDGSPSQPPKFSFSNFNEYLLKSYQEPSVGSEMASCWGGKPDAIPGSKGLTCKVRGQARQRPVSAHSVIHLLVNVYGVPAWSKPNVSSGDTVVSKWCLRSNGR